MSDSVSNLTELVQQNACGPIVGRQQEIQCLVDILCREKKSNPILIGKMGVGRSSIVMGLARYIAENKLPENLKEAVLLRIDVNKVVSVSDTPLKQLKQIVEDLISKTQNSILIFDELEAIHHQDEKSANKIVSYIKKLIIHEKVRAILICDESFYKRDIVPDSYMMRACMPLSIFPPHLEQAIKIIQAHAEQISVRYAINIPKEVVLSVVKLAQIYLMDISFPESAVNLLDAVAASLQTRRANKKMSQGDVVNVLSEWTEIRTEILKTSFEEKILHCAQTLSQYVYGQKRALGAIEKALQVGYMQLGSSSPIACLLFAGPQGVGKKMTAIELNKMLYESERHLHHFDMSGYAQLNDVEKLLGPFNTTDTVGSLTKALLQCPYSVCLFEHIELAHPRVLQALHEAIVKEPADKHDFSKAIIVLTTEVGSDLTAGQEFIMEKKEQQSELLQLVVDDLPEIFTQHTVVDVGHDILSEKLAPVLSKELGDQFLQGVKVIPFLYWDRSDLMHYFLDQLEGVKDNLKKEHQIDLYYEVGISNDVSHLLSATQRDAISIKQFVEEKILSEISRAVFNAKSLGKTVNRLELSVDAYGEIICK